MQSTFIMKSFFLKLKKLRQKHSTVYLDHASATPADVQVIKAMSPYLAIDFANPSSLYTEGVRVKHAVRDAREFIAQTFGVSSREIIFTSGGTESDNLAIFGVVENAHIQGIAMPHIVTTNIEHSAVLETCRALESRGRATVTYVAVDSNGIINPRALKDALIPSTVLVSVMYANNEIGTIQPIQEIAKIIRHFKKNRTSDFSLATNYPYFHTDAAQAVQYLPIRMDSLGVDMLSCNGSKIYGPKGVGVLVKKTHVQIEPMVYGGNQEYKFRAGTENVSGIVGIAEAFRLSEKMKEKESTRLEKIRDYFFTIIKKTIPQVIINGDEKERLPNNINISIPHIDSELLVIELGARGILVSSKSACKSDDPNESYVLDAIHQARPDHNSENEGSIRISLGRSTVKKDMDRVVGALVEIFEKYSRFTT